MNTLVRLVIITLIVMTQQSFADVTLPGIFSSNAVLQQQKPVKIWGWAAPNEKVAVSFAGQSVTAIANAEGKWSTELQPLKASATPQTLTVTGNNEIKLDNILVGEVWLCSGQSNMEWDMYRNADDKALIPNIKNPNIRLFEVTDHKAWKSEPQDNYDVKINWTECNPETIKDFSAVGYHFGAALQKQLNVPIGLIDCAWGGTRIEPWIPAQGFATVPALKSFVDQINVKDINSPAYKKIVHDTLKQYQDWLNAAAKNTHQRLAPPPAFPQQILPFTDRQPTTLFNAMVHPFAGLSMRGAIWYQGESNNGEGQLYGEKMKALINGWRDVFGKDLGFYWVQIAPFNYGAGKEQQLPELQVAQSGIEKFYQYDNVGQAVINDIGNPKNIHPDKKIIVGGRLANLALNRTYGQKAIACSFPELDTIKVEDRTVVVSFKNAKEMKTRDGKAPAWFEIAGADNVYQPATAVMSGTTVKLTSEKVEKPCSVRFGWNQIAEPNLENENGLPVGPFKVGISLPKG